MHIALLMTYRFRTQGIGVSPERCYPEIGLNEKTIKTVGIETQSETCNVVYSTSLGILTGRPGGYPARLAHIKNSFNAPTEFRACIFLLPKKEALCSEACVCVYGGVISKGWRVTQEPVALALHFVCRGKGG